jgi:hypothetical protein
MLDTNAFREGMKKLAISIAMFALLPLPVRSEPLSAHLIDSIEVDLSNQLPIRLPIQSNPTRIFKRYGEDIRCCFDCLPELFPLEPFSILLHRDFEQSLFVRFDNCWP